MDDLEDISARVGRMEDLSSERIHQDQMARLSPSRLGDAGMPPEPTVGASPFDVSTVIADGAVGAAALAANIFAAPSVALGTAAAVGAASTLIRSDATIAAFDVTVPVTQAFGDAAATGSDGFAARRGHRHGMPANPVTAHEAAADPHTAYQRESEKATASGYASLDAGTLVPVAQIATGAPDGTKFLRDDRTWQAPVAAANRTFPFFIS